MRFCGYSWHESRILFTGSPTVCASSKARARSYVVVENYILDFTASKHYPVFYSAQLSNIKPGDFSPSELGRILPSFEGALERFAFEFKFVGEMSATYAAWLCCKRWPSIVTSILSHQVESKMKTTEAFFMK